MSAFQSYPNYVEHRYEYEEHPAKTEYPFMDKNIRHGFIRKVYSLLTIQMIFTVGVSTLFVCNEDVKKFAVSEGGQACMWVSIVGMFGIMITMICSSNSMRKYPTNYIILSIFTIFTSYMVGSISASYKTSSVAMAFGATVAVTVALTIYAWQTKYDFTTMGGMLIGGLMGIIAISIINIFVQNSILQTVIAGFGVLIFSCYIVYDTQLIVGGKHRKLQFGIDDYVLATISLYLDIINLFLYLLQLIGGRGRD
jgi:protein lifeguard